MKTLARRRVLVVDDNAHARAFLTQILGAVEVEVVPAESGAEALLILKTIQVDAVISDIFMRPMDGLALTKAIRASDSPEIAGVPVILASAQASREVVHGGVVAGATGFIAKPFSPAAVLKRLAIALERKGPVADAPHEEADNQALAYL